GRSGEVKRFAQKMIDDHTHANKELAQLAASEDIEVSDDATLMEQTKAMILEYREGENFDAAYATNQVVAHEQNIEIFRDYLNEGENAELKSFAQKTLPKLEQHLKMARELQAQHAEQE